MDIKITFTLLIAFTAIWCTAQEDAGRIVVGGSVIFSVSDSEVPSDQPFGGVFGNGSVFTFSPYIGKELNERWVLGFAPSISFSHSETASFGSTGKSDGLGYSLSVFARYNFNPASTIVVFLRPRAGYSYSKSDFISTGVILPTERETSYFEIGLAPGVAWNASPRFRLLTSLGGISYRNGTETFPDENSEKNFSVFSTSFDLAITSLGIELRF